MFQDDSPRKVEGMEGEGGGKGGGSRKEDKEGEESIIGRHSVYICEANINLVHSNEFGNQSVVKPSLITMDRSIHFLN